MTAIAAFSSPDGTEVHSDGRIQSVGFDRDYLRNLGRKLFVDDDYNVLVGDDIYPAKIKALRTRIFEETTASSKAKFQRVLGRTLVEYGVLRFDDTPSRVDMKSVREGINTLVEAGELESNEPNQALLDPTSRYIILKLKESLREQEFKQLFPSVAIQSRIVCEL